MNKILKYFKGDDLAASSWVNKYRHGEETMQEFFERVSNEFIRLDTSWDKVKILSDFTYHNLSEYGKKRSEMSKEERTKLTKGLFADFKHIIPGGSALSGLGTNKPVSLSNCFVIQSPQDTIESIFNNARDKAQIYKRRGGVGEDLSNLRPTGARVNNASKQSTGVTSWMNLYSETTNTIGQDGRRGALMLSIDIRHPDSPLFAEIKQDLTKVTGANVSVKLTQDFIEAVKNEEDYLLQFPIETNIGNPNDHIFYDSNDNGKHFSEMNYDELHYIVDAMGDEMYFKKVNAKKLWDSIIYYAWNSGEPGIFNWDRVLDYDPTSVYSELKAVSTNPCGELPLGPYDSCRLIASNLYSLVKNPFSANAQFDEDLAYQVFYETQIYADIFVDLELEAVERILTKISPNWRVDQVSAGWLDHKSDEFKLWWKVKNIGQSGRRTGTGITGYADMLAALNLPYGDEQFTDKVFKLKLQAELDASIDLAIINGAFPLWDVNKEYKQVGARDGEFSRKLTRFNEVNPSIIDFNPCNDWYTFIAKTYPKQFERMFQFGRRNAGISTIAPTGTISMMTQTSSGCEPVFALYYTRRRKCNPGETATFVDQNGVGFVEYNVIHHKFQTWYDEYYDRLHLGTPYIKLNDASQEFLDNIIEKSPWHLQTSEHINPFERVVTQSIMQKYITSSISSTVNLPESATPNDIATIYNEAFAGGCKGITVYRDGSRSGILVKNSDIKIDPSFGPMLEPRPDELECKVIHFKNEDKKHWTAFVGLMNGRPYEIFTGIRDLEFLPIPSYVTEGKIIKVKEGDEPSRYDFQYKDSYGYTNTLGGLSKVFNKEYWNYARLISALMREGIEIDRLMTVVDKLEFETKTLNNWKNGVMRSVKDYIPEGKETGTQCPECTNEMVFEGGCEICKNCGHSKCL